LTKSRRRSRRGRVSRRARPNPAATAVATSADKAAASKRAQGERRFRFPKALILPISVHFRTTISSELTFFSYSESSLFSGLNQLERNFLIGGVRRTKITMVMCDVRAQPGDIRRLFARALPIGVVMAQSQ
jgi:hypothetical protein